MGVIIEIPIELVGFGQHMIGRVANEFGEALRPCQRRDSGGGRRVDTASYSIETLGTEQLGRDQAGCVDKSPQRACDRGPPTESVDADVVARFGGGDETCVALQHLPIEWRGSSPPGRVGV